MKQQKTETIIEAAIIIFSEKGFEKSTMQQISTEANIGIATLFRYYPKKEKLIVAVALSILDNYYYAFESIEQTEATCLVKIEKLFDFFASQLYEENLKPTQLIESFESYAALSAIPLEDMEKYNEAHRKISTVFSNIIEQGKKDGSIRKTIVPKETLTSIINAYALFSRKLSLFQSVPLFETDIEPNRQLAVIKQIFMDYLRATEKL